MILLEKTDINCSSVRALLWGFLFVMIGCRESIQKTPIEVSLKHEVRLSKSDNPSNDPILVLLHGYGSNEKDLFTFVQYLPENLTLITPQAPIILYENQHAWYNINIDEGSSRYDFNEVKKAKTTILKFVQEVKSKYDLKSKKIFIGGFSQGAIMSLYLGLTEPEFIEGVIALSGHLYPEVKNEIDFKNMDELPSFFISHGRKDKVLAFSQAEAGVQYLESQNIEVDEFYYDTRHSISRDNLDDMRAWFNNQLKSD